MLRRRARLALVAAGAGAVGLVSVDLFLSWRYGLGRPPVMLSDPTMEYRYAPNGHYFRRGNRIDINAYSMRSDAFPPAKTSPDERRVMVIGDSVINGGAPTDQDQLATSILQARLRQTFHVPVVVGNISAGSWGPQNELAYVERFGLFAADVVVVVVSGHDATDEIGPLPGNEQVISPHYRLALEELAERFHTASPPAELPVNVGRAPPCLAAFDALLARIRADGATPIVVFHFERPEIDLPGEAAGHAMFRAVCARHGIEPTLLKPAFAASLAAGRDPYRDYIHPNVIGQRVLADTITPLVEAALRRAAATSHQ